MYFLEILHAKTFSYTLNESKQIAKKYKEKNVSKVKCNLSIFMAFRSSPTHRVVDLKCYQLV